MIRLRQVKINILNDNEDVRKEKIAKLLKINSTKIKDIYINKKSIDARLKDQIFYIYEFDVLVNDEADILKNIHNNDIFLTPNEKYVYPIPGKEKLNSPIVIVGCGPAGLFAAYLLAQMGYKPLIIERGKKIIDRINDVENFWQNNILNTESNVQFGEGGAGTFSDGKLNTLVKDKKFIAKKILEIFVECGAPEEIMYIQHPHIGTDILRKVILNMRKKIENMGGIFRFNTKLTNLIIDNNELQKIEVNNNEIISCSNLILAIGHSARDTFKMLYDNNIKMEAKPFAVGIRIMHPQEMIDKNQYGHLSTYLPPANYKLTYNTKTKRGVYSFCMCPGGYVVNSSSEKNKLVINGMSNYKRDSKMANSAIIVSVTPSDFGNHPLAGIEFQRKLEDQAYKIGKSFIPIQTWHDFKLNQKTTHLDIVPVTKGNYTLANIREILPNFINEALLEAMPEFEKKIKGFANDSTILAAIESRSSSPIRIRRNEAYQANIKGIYPCGEGAGYAGGITTSAMDGIKVAEEIIKVYCN